MPRSLADGKTKFVVTATQPANPALPTPAELNAMIDLSCKVLADGFAWTFADSDKVAEKALCDTGNANSLGPDNLNLGFTLFRYCLAGGGVDTANDTGFAAVKTKGVTLWGYARKSDKLASAAFATTDVLQLGAEFTVDQLQDPGGGGWIKYRVPCEGQRSWPWIVVPA